jgi:MerR family transcriptional regulator, copper efflux regulator
LTLYCGIGLSCRNVRLHTIRFIRRAQALGFTLDEIRDLLGLWAESTKSCTAAERRASSTLGRIEAKIADLGDMRDALTQYVAACRNRISLHDCPLLAGLGGPEDGHGG